MRGNAPFAIVNPVMVTVTPLLTSKTPTWLPPLTVTFEAPGPVITTGTLVLVRLSDPRLVESVMVWGWAKTPLVSNRIVSGVAGLGLRFALLLLTLLLAQFTAERSVPTSLESAADVTRYDELASNAPMSGAVPAL